MMKKYLCILAVLVFFVLNSSTSYACTGVYIGKEASADGTFILAPTAIPGSLSRN